VQHYGSESLDAANLMMALTFFMSPTDPRMLATLDATLLPLEKDGLTANSLVYRYNIGRTMDGLSALTRAGRHDRSRLEEARLIFERAVCYREPARSRNCERGDSARQGHARWAHPNAGDEQHLGDECHHL
jgi:hypothetical protein